MLQNIKLLLGIKDDVQDDLLNLIISMTEQQFILFLKSHGVDAESTEYDFIITEVAVKRFNRIGSEGMTQVSVEGHSVQFSQNDFDEYERYLALHEDAHDTPRRGRVRFL